MKHEIALFSSLDATERASLEASGVRRAVKADHVFLRMGDRNTTLFVVLAGSVRVSRIAVEKDTELTTLGAGSVFGEMSFLDASRASATVTAAEPSEVLELSQAALDRVLEEHPALAAKLWRNLAKELKQRLARTNELVDHYVDLAQVLRENPGCADLLGGF